MPHHSMLRLIPQHMPARQYLLGISPLLNYNIRQHAVYLDANDADVRSNSAR
jgi:hypothetical protein